MSVCPVCENHHQEEVEQCQRCNWSMQDDVGISLDHPILKTCISTLVNNLEEEIAVKKKLQSIIQKIELQEADNCKLDEILDELETDRKQTHKQLENLSVIIYELKSSLLEAKNKSSDIPSNIIDRTSARKQSSPEPNQTSKKNIPIVYSDSELLIDDVRLNSPVSLPSLSKGINHNNSFVEKSDRNIDNSFNLTNNEPESGLYNETSDRNTNYNFNSINEPQENSLSNQTGEQEFFTNYEQENNQPEANLNNSYQKFYSMIKRGQLEVIKVKVPQKTVEQMRSGTQSELKFANDNKGNYWIINWHDTYCLIPKEKTYINPHQYGNFQRVFNCENYQETYQDFEVIEPATVVNCDSEIWRLERKGKIEFI